MSFFVKEMPENETPIAKAQKNIFHLTDGELLAIVLGNDTPKTSSLDLAYRLLKKFGSFMKLSTATQAELIAQGLTAKKATLLRAALEISARFNGQELIKGMLINGSKVVADHYIPIFRTVVKEEMHLLTLDSKHRIIQEMCLSVGSLNLSIVHPREVFRAAIKDCAADILLIHNHPSGDPSPSTEDCCVTQRIAEAGKLVGISLLDHVIIGHTSYYSFAEAFNPALG